MSLALSLFLAALLAVSALHKVMARQRLAGVTARLARVSPGLGLPMLLSAAAIEAMAALALIAAPLHQGGALAAAALWLVYGAALTSRHGQTLDCGCDLFAHERPVDLFAIARPFALALLAAVLAIAPADPFTPDAPFAALAFLALWFAAGELAALPHLARMSRR